MKKDRSQPAKINYFFKDGFIEFKDALKDLFLNVGEVIEDSWDDTKDGFGDLLDIFDEPGDGIKGAFKFGFSLMKLICVAILSTLICAFISAIQIAVLTAFAILMFLGWMIALISDSLYSWIKNIGVSCPKCQAKFSLATYVCPCGAKHTRLLPGRYGVLKRECKCGRKIGSTFFSGKGNLPGKWVCPDCGYELNGMQQVDITIPVIGGQSSGKTCFINMAITEIEKKALSFKLEFAYMKNAALNDDYEANKMQMAQGFVPRSTNDKKLMYRQFYLTPKGNKVKNMISVCDIAGEAYRSVDDINTQIAFKNAQSFLFVLDPLSSAKYKSQIKDTVSNIADYNGSGMNMDEVLGTFINTLRSWRKLGGNAKIPVDLVIVFTKADIPGLDKKIGAPAVNQYMTANPGVIKYDAMNEVCMKFLKECGEFNFINMLGSFRSVQFFSSSALGHVVNGKAFAPEGVDEPLLWLIDKESASINLKSLWSKKL